MRGTFEPKMTDPTCHLGHRPPKCTTANGLRWLSFCSLGSIPSVLLETFVGLMTLSVYAGMRLGFFAPRSTEALNEAMGPTTVLERFILRGGFLALVGAAVIQALFRWTG